MTAQEEQVARTAVQDEVGAAIAHDKQQKTDKGSRDWNFYEGKKQAAIYFAQNILPDVIAKARAERPKG